MQIAPTPAYRQEVSFGQFGSLVEPRFAAVTDEHVHWP